eukprot:EG_transcript_11432
MPSAASALPAAFVVASVAPDDAAPAAECVTGTVVVDRHAKDIQTIHSLLSPGVAVALFGRPYAYVLAHLANGTWAAVFHVLREETKQFAALKVIPVGASNADSYHAEVDTLRKLHHPNVVQYCGHFVRQLGNVRCLCIELEFCARQTLEAYLAAQQRRKGQLETAQLLDFVTQIASALEYIHSQEVLHGDLRPETVLVTKQWQLKLASFGSPLWVERNARIRRTITGGDRVYAPPEWADSVVPHRRLSPTETPLPSYDMWSLGCVVTELATLKLLRADRGCTSALSADPPTLYGILEEVAATHRGLLALLCAKLLVPDSSERLMAEEACFLLRRLQAEPVPVKTPRSARSWFSSIRRSRSRGATV